MSTLPRRSSSPTSLEQLVKNVYAEVWKQFHDWDTIYCQGVIESLRAPSTAPSPALHYIGDPQNHISDVLNEFQGLSIDADSRILAMDFSSDGSISYSKIIAEKIPIRGSVPPSEAYESYTPCPRNIEFGDDADNMMFIPYADEPRFDPEDYMGWFDSLSWQNDTFRDPDVDSIEIETVHRLHFGHGVPIEDIDNTGILSVPLRKGKGFIHNAAQRDLLHWQGSALTEGFPLPCPLVPDSSNTGLRLQSLSSDFCPNLNCIQPYCSVHEISTPRPPTSQATLTSLDLREQTKHPCEHNCFLYLDGSKEEIITSWRAADEEDLRCALKLMPDTSPCDLAIICRKPCREIYFQRQCFLSDDEIAIQNQKNGNEDEAGLRKKQRRVKFTVKHPGKLDSIKLCAHEGPCDGENCPCFEKNGYCERNCGCPLSCIRRWRGCQCSKRSYPCSDERCRCFRAHRECDPEMCQTCDAKGLCTNCDIQRGDVKAYRILRSKWGLGVFLSVPARQNDFIGEYVGELVHQRTYDENRQHLSDYRGRNYLYALNKDVCIDSTFAGNHTRFINHSENQNCRATILIVNGEFRIGIWATRAINRGSELFLNYGEAFFKKLPQDAHLSSNSTS